METLQTDTVQEVSGIVAFLTLATCGEGCWHALEDVCRCSCGGKNHGCLKTASGISPMRMAKIDGFMYQLKAFGKYRDLYGKANEINLASNRRKKSAFDTNGYPYKETDHGAPARLKPPTYEQTQRWTELSQFKGMGKWGIYHANGDYLYGLWERMA